MKLKINNFDSATKIILLSNRILSLRNTESPKNRLRWILVYLYNISCVTIFVALSCILDMHNTYVVHTPIERALYIFESKANVIGFVIMIIYGWYQSMNLLHLRKRIAAVDNDLNKLNIEMNYRRFFYRLLIFCCIWFGDSIIFTLIFLKTTVSTYGPLFGSIVMNFFYLSNIASLILLEFMLYVYWLGLRFKDTNGLLKAFVAEEHQYNTTVSDSKLINPMRYFRHENPRSLSKWFQLNQSLNRTQVVPVEITSSVNENPQYVKKKCLLQDIRLLHLRLCCLGKLVNKIFDFQLTIMVIVYLVYLITILYYIYTDLSNIKLNLFGMENHVLGFSALHTFLCCLKIVVACVVCENTYKEANRVMQIIHQYSGYQIDDEVKEEILQFSLQLLHIQCGRTNFFRLSYQLIRKCLGSATTYLVIMIQWNQSIEEQSPSSINNAIPNL